MPTGPRSHLTRALADIKLAHSVFALPFAITAAFLAAPIEWPRFIPQLVLIIACMVLARTWAMLVNRLADHDIDARNPRTSRRAFASAAVPINFGLALAVTCAVGFIAIATLFFVFFDNPYPPLLAIPVLAWIALYSFTKRFTFLAHLFLGSALAVSPIATLIAINPDIAFNPIANPTARSIYLLSGFVMLWVAAFDIAYALQDLDFDRTANLHSVPSRFGFTPALWIARALHLLALLLLLASWHAAPQLASLSLAAVIAVAILILTEHIVLTRRGLAGLPMAFFTLNGIAALVFASAACADVLLN
ncbi:MAG: putative 4-hydroxybenzoate polyprenyltransferase [Phycisphaerales bacterium]|nr:putative 4-hydroxybenzoate polyprenyltransferase [Phycisphaerales bacterium]